jgi:acyl-coenzyme A synthetase/AMP-(fatty) acid ligase
MGADGAISYAGRRDDMMNAGGYRVSPIEVETALSAHPNVQDVGAVAVTVKKDVTVIAVFYTSTTVLDEEVLRDWCTARLAPYKMPRLFVACDELPRGANNKLLRRMLRHNWETAHGQT